MFYNYSISAAYNVAFSASTFFGQKKVDAVIFGKIGQSRTSCLCIASRVMNAIADLNGDDELIDESIKKDVIWLDEAIGYSRKGRKDRKNLSRVFE